MDQPYFFRLAFSAGPHLSWHWHLQRRAARRDSAYAYLRAVRPPRLAVSLGLTHFFQRQESLLARAGILRIAALIESTGNPRQRYETFFATPSPPSGYRISTRTAFAKRSHCTATKNAMILKR
jgi:hypothetical protein